MQYPSDRPGKMRTLIFLRIYGPIGNADLARKMNLDHGIVYGHLYLLMGSGLAYRVRRGLYDVTEAGRKLTDKELSQPLFERESE